MSNTNGFVNLPTGIYLNVRKEPNFYSAVLTSLAPKTELTILEQNGDWYQIEYNNAKAYVFTQAVSTNSKINIKGITLNLNLPTVERFEQPTFNWNALVISKENIPIKDANGNVLTGLCTSNGDHITIIQNNIESNLTFIQYPDQGANCYQQGWIDSSYISSEYLDFRFQDTWINNEENQQVYLFDNTISNVTLDKGAKYTLLYTVSNYNIEYTCILFEENNNLQIGFILSSTGQLNFVLKGYPYNIGNEASIGTFKPTVPANATTLSDIKLIDANGIEPYYVVKSKTETIYPTISANSRISILEIFNSAEQDSILMEYYDAGNNIYKKGYLPLEALVNKEIILDSSNVVWDNSIKTIEVMDITNSRIIAKLLPNTIANLLYIADEYACIEFENQTGYVLLSDIANDSLKEKELKIRLANLEKKFNKFTTTKTSKNENISKEISNIDLVEKTFDSTIKKLQQNIDNNKQVESSLSQDISDLKIDSKLIGGINLVNNSATNFGKDGLSSNAYGFGTGIVTLGAGRTYTLTICGETLQEAHDNGQHLVVEIYNSDWSSWARLDFEEVAPCIKQAKITVPKTETYWINSYPYPHKTNAKDVKIYWYNVQEGEVGTAWVPSINDLQILLNESNENK